MSEQWYRDYILLGLRIDKVMRDVAESACVDAYYGPAELEEMVEDEPEISVSSLVSAAIELAEALPEQGFEPQHASYLRKQVMSMETLCRKLHGETFTLEDEVQRCFDACPAWIPE